MKKKIVSRGTVSTYSERRLVVVVETRSERVQRSSSSSSSSRRKQYGERGGGRENVWEAGRLGGLSRKRETGGQQQRQARLPVLWRPLTP